MADLRKDSCVRSYLVLGLLTPGSVHRTWWYYRHWFLQRQQQVPRHRRSSRSAGSSGGCGRHCHIGDGMHLRAHSALANTKRNGGICEDLCR